WAMVVASKAAFWDGDFAFAAECARNGQQHAATGTALVMLACQEGDAFQQMGLISEADGAVERAKEAREHIVGADDVGGLFSCGSARRANYELAVHLAARRPQDAIAAAEDAREAFASGDQWAYGTWAQVHFGLAQAQIMLNNLDVAGNVLDPVLSMP